MRATFPKSILLDPKTCAVPLVFVIWHGLRAFVIRMRDESDFTSIDAYAMIQIAILGLLSVSTFILWWKNRTGTRLHSRAFGLLILYYVICLASASWSTLQAYSAYRAVEMIVFILAVLLLAHRYENFQDLERALLQLALMLILVKFCSRVVMFINGWRSFDCFHQNGLAASCMMVFLYCLGEFPRATDDRRSRLRVLAVSSGVLLYLSGSAASLISVCIGMLFLSLYRRRQYHQVALFFLVGALLLLLLLGGGDSLVGAVFRDKTHKEIMSLHGRIVLWEAYWAAYCDSPLYGHGFATAGRSATKWGGFYATNTHNSFIAVTLNTGLLGLTIISYWLYSIFREARINLLRSRPGAWGISAAFVGALVNGNTVPLMGGAWYESSTFFLIVLALHAGLTSECAETGR